MSGWSYPDAAALASEAEPSTLAPWRNALQLGLAYLALALLSMALSRQDGSIAQIWLPNAMAVGWLLTSPRRQAPALIGAAALAVLLANLLVGDSWLRALIFVPPNLLDIGVGAWLLQRAGVDRDAASRLRSTRGMLTVLVLGALLPQFGGATLGALTLGLQGSAGFAPFWLAWIEGSTIGAVSMLGWTLCLRSSPSGWGAQFQDRRFWALAMVASGVCLLAQAHVAFPFIFIALPLLAAALALDMLLVLSLVLMVALLVALGLALGIFLPPPFSHEWEQLLLFAAFAGSLLPAQLLTAAVSEMRDQQAQLAAASAELLRVNEGLEQFVRIASHDLREPLNTVNQFTELLDHDHGAQLPPPAQRWLQLVRGAGERMGLLLDDVLAYTRMQRPLSESMDQVDLQTLVQEVLASLGAALRDSGARVQVEPLPAVRGHASLLSLALQNLISNALKFRRPDQAPEVVIAAHADGDWLCLSVSDKGIGIAAEDQGRLFQPFKRLNLRRHYEGTGLGLAMVRQVALAHGGEVRLRSEPGKGSCFEILLPRNQIGAPNTVNTPV